jgi:uncharacterized protein
MSRLLVIVLLVVVAVWLLRRALRRLGQGPEASKPAAPGELVRCAHCGMHLPLAEARARDDRVYCSDEHARLGPRKG